MKYCVSIVYFLDSYGMFPLSLFTKFRIPRNNPQKYRRKWRTTMGFRIFYIVFFYINKNKIKIEWNTVKRNTSISNFEIYGRFYDFWKIEIFSIFRRFPAISRLMNRLNPSKTRRLRWGEPMIGGLVEKSCHQIQVPLWPLRISWLGLHYHGLFSIRWSI
jgi:hypothetical protein